MWVIGRSNSKEKHAWTLQWEEEYKENKGTWNPQKENHVIKQTAKRKENSVQHKRRGKLTGEGKRLDMGDSARILCGHLQLRKSQQHWKVWHSRPLGVALSSSGSSVVGQGGVAIFTVAWWTLWPRCSASTWWSRQARGATLTYPARQTNARRTGRTCSINIIVLHINTILDPKYENNVKKCYIKN